MIERHTPPIQSAIRSNPIFFRLSKLNLFSDFRQNFASFYLPMAITIVRFIGMKHTNIRWKSEEDVYAFGIQSFWSFHFEACAKIRNSQFPPNLFSAEFRSIHQLR
jgi:hypothetical protein